MHYYGLLPISLCMHYAWQHFNNRHKLKILELSIFYPVPGIQLVNGVQDVNRAMKTEGAWDGHPPVPA